MLKGIGKFIIESIDKDEKIFIKEFKEKYISAIREGLDADIRRQIEENEENEEKEEENELEVDTDELANDIISDNDEENINDIETNEEESIDNIDRLKVDKLIINSDEVRLNTSDDNIVNDDESLELNDTNKDKDEDDDDEEEEEEEISITGNEISDLSNEISADLGDEEIYENLLSEEDEIDDMSKDETVDIPMNVTDDDAEEKMLTTDEKLLDTMIIDADTIEINAKNVTTETTDDVGFEDESFEDEFDDTETVVSDDGEDIYNVENVDDKDIYNVENVDDDDNDDDDDEIAEKYKLNKKPIKEEESEQELMTTFENHLNEKGENGSEMRKNNPEEFAKRYSLWLKDIKGN